jgi:hypothetical protein
MKNLKFNQILLFIIIFIPAIIFAQEKSTATPAPPAPPAEPNYDFSFDFEGFPEMKEQEEKALLQNLKKDLQDQLKIIKTKNKEKYFEFLQQSQFKNMRIPFIAKREKEMYERENKIFELEVNTEALATQYKSAAKSEKERIKTELKQKLNDLFVQKEEDRKQEVQKLEQELKELKESLDVRLKNKNEIINRRMQELLDEDKYLDWE